MKNTSCGSLTRAVIVTLLVSVSNTGMAASLLSHTNAWTQDNGLSTTSNLRIDDDLPNDWPSVDLPPPDDPEPLCAAGSRTYTASNDLLTELLFLLDGTRVQISHTRQGEPIVGEPRTLNLAKGITAAKFEQLERAQEQRCEQQPNPGQCMTSWYQQMNETVVHTIEPEYHSYVKWSNLFAALTGLSFTPVPVPVVEKSVQSGVAKAVTSLLILPIAVNVDKARCHINQMESTLSRVNNTHPVEIRNGRLEMGFPLESVGYPTLKCEGRAVALWGWYTWGWADRFFPDVDLTNMNLSVSFGGFRAVDKLPMYGFVNVGVDADIDLNNIPGVGESVVSFFKDYSGKARAKVAAALREKLMSDTVREAFGRALVGIVETKTGDKVGQVCDVRAAGDTIDIDYEIAPVSTTIEFLPDVSTTFQN